jgi:fused signal recognition particle receptor
MKSLFSVFKKGLQKTATSVARSVGSLLSDIEKWDASTFDDLEAALISADFGTETTFQLVEDIRDRYERGLIKTSEDVNKVISGDIYKILNKNSRPINFNNNGLTVIFMVGVNGSGKTTTSGKLAWQWKREGKRVSLAACDTFRAAAVEQLKLWGERIDCHVVASKTGADPSSVVYDAVESALARNSDILIVDTAGRQHNKKGLMEELAKMKRTAEKVCPGAPHEVWLTIDAGIGTNALQQTQEFTKFSGVTGIILTKLDGTGKGGMAVAIQGRYDSPVFFAGFGEQPEDLQPFNPEMFTEAIFGSRREV